MKFLKNKTAFGRHETFTLRYSWLTKGLNALRSDSSIFTSPDASVTLGVGKNMVNSIRYWLLASQLISKESTNYVITELGGLIFGPEGYDPYLEDEATIWLIHWLVATNPTMATAWYWFFNKFHKPEFTSQEMGVALVEFARNDITNKFSDNTVEKEAAILLRMYSQSMIKGKKPLEDVLDSPLSLLGLVTQNPDGRTYTSQPLERDNLPIGIFGFAVIQLMNELNTTVIPIENLMYSKNAYPAPGAVFRLTENALLTKLEQLIHLTPNILSLRETAGIHQVYLSQNKTDPAVVLNKHYQGKLQVQAA